MSGFKESVKETFTSEFVLSICLHCLILFTILTCFYYLIVSPIEEASFNAQFSSVISSGTNDALQSVDVGLSTSKNENPIKNYLQTNATSINDIYNIENVPDPTKVVNNSWLKFTNLLVLGLFFTFLVVLFIILKYVSKKAINIQKLMVENLLIFLFVGMVELYFFLNIASKYAFTTPSNLSTTVINRVKQNLST